MTANIGTTIIAPIVPPDSLDTYPTHQANYGLGGIHHCLTIAERDAISIDRRQEGMLATVKSDSNTYQLVDGAWVLYQAGVDGSLLKYGTTSQRTTLGAGLSPANTGHQFYDLDETTLYIWAYDHWERPVIEIGTPVIRDYIGTDTEVLPLMYRAGDRWTDTDSNYTVRVCKATTITHTLADWVSIGRQS
jgi:hypothetical protein